MSLERAQIIESSETTPGAVRIFGLIYGKSQTGDHFRTGSRQSEGSHQKQPAQIFPPQHHLDAQPVGQK
jgi:hypothetical protein